MFMFIVFIVCDWCCGGGPAPPPRRITAAGNITGRGGGAAALALAHTYRVEQTQQEYKNTEFRNIEALSNEYYYDGESQNIQSRIQKSE